MGQGLKYTIKKDPEKGIYLVNEQKPQSLFEKKSDQTRKRGTIKWD